jgi:hypothetical protein
MNKEKTDKLIKDFPHLYRGHNESPRHNLMCFGFECGDGWYELIYDLSEKLSRISNEIKAVQVKEKFGGLRFYVDFGDKWSWALIDRASEESLKTCEECGDPATKDPDTNPYRWIRTECDECREKRRHGET